MRKLSVIHNKVARRILLSFILAALLPIGILGILSYRYVNNQLHEQTTKSLHKSTKDYTLRLIDRLTIVDNALHVLANNVTNTGNGFNLTLPNENSQNLLNQFASLSVVISNAQKIPLLTGNSNIPDLNRTDFAEVKTGKTLIKSVVDTISGTRGLLIAVPLSTKQKPAMGILLAELKPEFIWESDNVVPNNLWVISQTGQLLFASEPTLPLPPTIREFTNNAYSGKLAWQTPNGSYLGAYRKIALNSFFSTTEFTVVQAQPKELAFAAIRQFSLIYPPVILLATLIVAFLSSRLIAKYLNPLERLNTATLRIANGDLDTHVSIHSHDEFENLAHSFNEMTRRLRSQFDILATMAEIDRNILSALNAEEIIAVALDRMPSILLCDLISIARINPETYQVSNIQTRRHSHDTEKTEDTIKLTLQDVLDLLAMQDNVIFTEANGKLSAYIHVFGNRGYWQYLVVPIVVNNTLSSIICLGYQSPNEIPPEASNAARNFGDRIAVALSNAAWEEKLYQQAHYDALTKLPNRLVLNDRLVQEIARAKRDDSQLAVFFIDLDRFKAINDSLGHAAGDELLVKVAQVLVGAVRATDLVVRIGGDEFVIVMGDLHNKPYPMRRVSTVAEKILDALKQPLIIADHPITVTSSLGIAVFPKDANNPQDLLKNADAALYHAKSEGRANFRFYSPELNAAALENIMLEQELRGAITRNELQVYFQPKVNLERRIVGAEALIRWQHAKLGMVSPAKFIPIAEQTGLVVEIGYWVLEQTCLWIKNCLNQGLEPVRISVNLSGLEFKRPELVDVVAGILAKTGIDPKYLELELTESVTVGSINNCITRMNELKNLGLTLSMDDFGTGFSSLSHLKNLPLDVIKIDQAFVRQLESDSSSQAIIKAILALAHGLDMKTVVEGVENENQLTFLKQQQCNVFQGFLFSRPLPAEEFFALLKAESHNKTLAQ